MSEHKEPIPSRIYNAAVGGHVAGTEDIIDDNVGQTQQEINHAIVDKSYSSADYSGMGRLNLQKNLVNIAEEGEEENIVNLLTQDMLFKGEPGSREPNTNTTFVIQYDYTLGEIKKEDVTIDGESSTEISGTTYYYTTIELEAGKCLRLLDVEHCVLLEDTTALLEKEEVIATEDTTVYIASTTADTYTEAYSIENVITIPVNGTLDFQGGSISNGTVVLNDTVLSGEVNFKDVAINGFFRRENFSQRPCFYLEDFGGKVNDQEVDNGPALQKAIDTANRVGGIVKFKAGRYYFTTGVQIADRLVVMTIEGSGFRADTSISESLPDAGTALVWQGAGWFMTFNGPIWKCIFRDFSVFCENNNGIKFIGSVYFTTLENINIRGFINGISIGKCAYCVIRMCEIGSQDYNVENNIIIGDSGGIEYLFMYNLAMQNDDQHGIGMNIYNGRHVYIKDCDFVQMDRAVYVHTEIITRWINIEDTDIANCNLAFDIDLVNSGMMTSRFVGVIVNTQAVMPTETVEIDGQQVTRQKCCILRGRRNSGYSIEGSVFDIIINKQGELPTNLIDISKFFAGYNTIIRTRSNSAEIKDAGAYNSYPFDNGGMSVFSNRTNDAYAVEVKGDGTSTTLDVPLGTDFYSALTLPNTVPCIVQSRNDNIASYTLSRDNGVLKVTITFKATFTNRDYITIYLPQIFELRYINM